MLPSAVVAAFLRALLIGSSPGETPQDIDLWLVMAFMQLARKVVKKFSATGNEGASGLVGDMQCILEQLMKLALLSE